MDINTILALIGATAILVLIPGPNVTLFVANTLAHGTRYGAATVLGTTIGVALQLTIVVLGLAIAIETAASALSWLRWIGVAYLIYLGVVSWLHGTEKFQGAPTCKKPISAVFWQGFFLATINPKTLLFSAAFLPQFVSHDIGPPLLLALPAAIYLSVIFLGDLCWVASAQFAKPAIMRLGGLRHRLTGCLFIGSGIGIALARIER